MPNLPTHFSFALDTLAALDDPSIKANLGSFLLGSTTPDIRARTKWKRSHTHFASLSVERVGVGAEGLFRSNPDLTEAARKSPATRAFLAGYLSHLVTDETWITQIYRPYFGNLDMFPDTMKANVYDRAVQLDMDRNARQEAPGMDKIIEQLHSSDRYVRVGFIDERPSTAGRRGWPTSAPAPSRGSASTSSPSAGTGAARRWRRRLRFSWPTRPQASGKSTNRCLKSGSASSGDTL